MGVKNLFNLISAKQITWSELSGKTIAIDGNLFVYQSWIIGETHSVAGHHIRGVYQRVSNLLKHNIRPIFVFDGPAIPQKVVTIRARAARAQYMPKSVHTDVRDLLTAMGVQYVVAPADAEAYCAQLTHTIAYAVLSEDSDSLAFGATRLLRGYNWKGKFQLYTLKDILKELHMTLRQFRHLCVLLGNDYNPRIAGPAKALVGAKLAPSKEIQALMSVFDVSYPISTPAYRTLAQIAAARDNRTLESIFDKHNVNKKLLAHTG